MVELNRFILKYLVEYYRRNNENDLKTIDSLKIESIDLVIVNLYKFDEARKELILMIK